MTVMVERDDGVFDRHSHRSRQLRGTRGREGLRVRLHRTSAEAPRRIGFADSLHRNALGQELMVLPVPNQERLADTLAMFSSSNVGGTPLGGVSRPAGSDADKAGRDRFAAVAEQLGLTVRVDDIGNMFARREGTDPTALPLVIGSHLDTVVPGGRFDGILGVAIALRPSLCSTTPN
jgi:hypothetical protein